MGILEVEASILEKAPFISPDPIFDLFKVHQEDPHPSKVLVGGGTYCDGDGKPWILQSVKLAKAAIEGCGHEYLPIAGLKTFRDRAIDLIFHGTRALEERRIASCQSLSGTGALFLSGLALRKMDPGPKDVLITSPTWPNHRLLYESMGFQVRGLPYYKNRAFDFDGYMAALRAARPGSIVILHGCAHNPTGCDPSKEEWKGIGKVIQAKKIFPIFDAAYLGFTSGNVDEDAWSIRYFVNDLGLEAAVCLSFSKNMGLYGERVGLVAFITKTPAAVRNVNSVLEHVQRATVTCPPFYGANIVSTILGTPSLKSQWEKDITTMSSRILSMRQKLYQMFLDLKTPGDWSHVVAQTGMFSYLGISTAQVMYLRANYHIYMSETSRIAITGLHDGNLAYFAQAVDRAVRDISDI